MFISMQLVIFSILQMGNKVGLGPTLLPLIIAIMQTGWILLCNVYLHPHSLLMWDSKNTRVSVTRKRLHWDQIPFKDDPEIGQLSADLTNNGVRLTQLWVTFRVKFTDCRVIVDPECSWPQWTLSGSHTIRIHNKDTQFSSPLQDSDGNVQ